MTKKRFSLRKKKQQSSAASTKPKSFRRIRGLITGQSRRERRARRAAEARAAGKPVSEHPEDDEETVYGVDLQAAAAARETSPAKKPAASLLGNTGGSADEEDEVAPPPTPASESLQVILLLMDPVTRRFELLQLEFDSAKAIVQDVLLQVPHSVTEDALRKKDFVGICDRNGHELGKKMRLKQFCQGSAEIFVGIPKGLPAKECARLARPILGDDKVMEMVCIVQVPLCLTGSRFLTIVFCVLYSAQVKWH